MPISDMLIAQFLAGYAKSGEIDGKDGLLGEVTNGLNRKKTYTYVGVSTSHG